MFSKFAESYYSITMKKHDMVPDHSFFEGMVGCWVELAPKDHYKNLEEGSILVKKSKTFSFCKEGVMVEGESTLVKSDIVILGTGFKGDQNIKNMFASKYFQRILIGSISMDVSLYRSSPIYIILFISSMYDKFLIYLVYIFSQGLCTSQDTTTRGHRIFRDLCKSPHFRTTGQVASTFYGWWI